MKIVAIASQKGGSGKTTLTRNIAVAGAACRYNTVLLDTDPQGSLTDWWNRREQETPPLVRQEGEVMSLLAQLKGAGDG